MQWDEGPDIGGPCAPYRQSERTQHYKQHAMDLVARGAAYPCFATAEELEAMRKEQIAAGKTPQYDRRYRSLPKDEAQARIDRGDPTSSAWPCRCRDRPALSMVCAADRHR